MVLPQSAYNARFARLDLLLMHTFIRIAPPANRHIKLTALRVQAAWVVRGICIAICALAISAGQGSLHAAPPAAPSATDDALIQLVDQAIAVTRQRNLDFQVHTPWQILHGLLALRNDYTLRNGPQTVNALEFISTQARYKGDRWFEATIHGGRAHPYNGTPYDFEGHVNQTLAIIAMCDPPLTHEFKVDGGRTITMADLVRHAQMTVNTQEETTWTLWFLTHYLSQDTEWTNAAGQRWSMEYLVRIQNASNVLTGPCGGCHGLFALAYARNSYLKEHGQLRGAWLEADQKLQQYVSAARSMQNRDGSFATQFFKARGFSYDFNERIKSSGHMLEWLMMALPRSRLEESWVRLGIQTLASDLIRNAVQPADCGPLYHSLHALILYKQRVQPDSVPTAPAELAVKPSAPAAAGPLTLSAPDDESMPGNKSPSQSAPVATAPAAPAQPVATAQKPADAVKNPVVIAPRPLSAPASTLKPADSTTPPVLLTPPTAAAPIPSQGASPSPQAPVRVVEQPEGVRKLSAQKGDSEKTSGATKPESTRLAPVPGGMPMLKPAADAPQLTPVEKTSPKAAPDTPANQEESRSANVPGAASPLGTGPEAAQGTKETTNSPAPANKPAEAGEIEKD